MRIYSASVLFKTSGYTNHKPIVGTTLSFRSVEQFIDWCEVQMREHPDFAKAYSCGINVIEVEIQGDGSQRKCSEVEREWK